MLTTYLFRYTSECAPLRSQIFKIFFASGGKGALTPALTEILRTLLLHRVRVYVRAGDATGVERATAQMPCCDVTQTSTGSMRTLAAALAKLNCPEHSTPPGAQPPGTCQPPHEPAHDLSHHAKRTGRLQPGSACQGRQGPAGCAGSSRGQMLVRFNAAYDSVAPDLRRNARTGKKHHFTDNIHSQILRGSTISQA